MHTQEAFLKKATTEEIATLVQEAEAQSPRHVQALKDQLTRLEIERNGTGL
jgi:uncharacterized protein YfkK (UPF0435 family)